MMRYLVALMALAAASPIGSASARLIGPPISPQLLFDAQPKPRTQLPPVYVPPVGDSSTTYSAPLIPGTR
jgi:ethanolamine utilization microcompartment shell protein EutL